MEIEMTDNLISIIGKNGSGKTTLLSAINTLFASRAERRYRRDLFGQFEISLKLTKKEYYKYSQHIADTKADRILRVKWQAGDIDGLVINSEIIPLSLSNIKNGLIEIEKQLEEDLDNYTEALQEIEFDTRNEILLDTYDVLDAKNNNLSNFYNFQAKHAKESGERIIKQIQDYIDNHFVIDEYIVNRNSYVPITSMYDHIGFVGVRYREILLSPLLSKCVTVDAEKYKQLVADMSKRLEGVYSRIVEGITQFNNIVDSFSNLVSRTADHLYDKYETQEKSAHSLIELILNTLYKGCYFLDNESGIMFGTDEYRYRERKNPVLVVLENLLREKHLISEDENLAKLSTLSPERQELAKETINTFLTSFVAGFDKDRIQTLFCEIIENGIKLKIKELDGTIVDLDETSLGRRWYLSYSFIKNILKQGEILIIDEPASFLHPEAQQEILHDLEELSKNHIVIISTHSPYMLSNKSSYYETKISESGIIINSIDKNDLLGIRDIIGLREYTNILFDSKAKHILVEGIRDVACLQRFMRMFDINEEDYNIFPCDGFSMATVAKFLEKHGRDFIAFIDMDHYNDDNIDDIKKRHNKEHAAMLIKSKFFMEFIAKAKKEPRRYIFVGRTEAKGEIEDLFSDRDRKSVLDSSGKVIASKVLNRKVYSDETINNFKDLFFAAGLLQI